MLYDRLWGRLSALAEGEKHFRNLIGMSLFRLVTGTAILSEYLTTYWQRHYLYGNEGLIPYELYARSLSHFSLYWFTRSTWSFELVYHASLVIVLLWTLGFKARLLTPLVFYCWTSFTDRGPPLTDGGDNLAAILLVFAAFADVGQHFSITRRGAVERERRSGIAGIFHNTALRAIGLQLCTVYFVAGVMKARGSTWLDGSALYASWADREFAWPGVTDVIAQNTLLLSIVGPLTILFQLSFPFLFLLGGRSRAVIVCVAMSFHLSIGLLMGLVSFAAFFIAAELATIGDEEYRAVGRWLQRQRQALAAAAQNLQAAAATRLRLYLARNSQS